MPGVLNLLRGQMKKKFNIGDLVEGGFGLLHHDYGFGIIVQKKTFGAGATAYRIYWSKNLPTWEPGRQLYLVAGINNV